MIVTLQQVSVRQPDSEQGVVVFSSFPLLVLLPHGFSAQHGVLLQQVAPEKHTNHKQSLQIAGMFVARDAWHSKVANKTGHQ